MAKKEELSLNSVVSRSTDLVSSNLDEEVVMMSIENGEYYGLDHIGTRIWEMIQKPVSIEKLVDELLNEFEVTREQCETDVMEFLTSLYEKKLINIHI